VAAFQGALMFRRNDTNHSSSPNGSQNPVWIEITRHPLDPMVREHIQRLIYPSESLWWYSENDWWVRDVNAAAAKESRMVHAPWSGNGFPGQSVELFKLLIVSQERTTLLFNQLAESDLPIHCSISQPGYIEIVSKAVGLDKGASRLREYEAGSSKHLIVLALGDSMNDLGMLEHSDLAVTFSDASNALRQAANLVVSSDRHSALKEIEQLLRGRRGARFLQAP
jgi:hydroxymethylpyrimidine pyrophosphatase-like HAD family hydrolase